MLLVVNTMAKAEIVEAVVESRPAMQVGAITASTADTQPVSS
jgi:hypothetical protein